MTKKIGVFLAVLAGILLVTKTAGAAITYPYNFTAGTTIRASEVNANFGTVRSQYNAHEADSNGHNTDLEDVLSVDNECTTPIDFNLTEAIDFRVQNLSSDPSCAGGQLGKLMWNTVEGLFKICDGSVWVSVAGTGVNTLQSVLNAGNSAGTFDIDMNGQEILDFRAENLAGDPAPGSAGRLFWNTTSTELKLDTGAAITAIGGAQSLSSVLSVGNSAGATDIDFNDNEALDMILHSTGVPPATVDGKIYFDTGTNQVNIYHSASWNQLGNTNTLAQTLTIGNSAGATDIDFNGNEAIELLVENLAFDVGSPALGRLWFNTASDRMKFGISGPNIRTVVTETDTQTLSNKTLSGAANTITNLQDAALSANVSLLNANQTISGTKTFSSPPIMSNILGGGVGVAGHVVPDLADDTLILKDAIQTMTNKSTADSFSINGSLDMNVNEIENFLVDNVPIEPAPGNAGRMVYKTATGELLFENGIAWFSLGTSTMPTWSQVLGSGASAGGTDPDVNLRQMLNMRAENLAAPLPAFGNPGRIVFNTSDSSMYYDDGSVFKAFVSDWAEALANGASAGATDPDVNDRQMLNMRLENIAGDPGAAQIGRVYYNTVAALPKYDDGAALHEFVDHDSVQTVSGKSMVATDNDITLPVIGSPTYTTIEDSNTVFNSAGQISGGVISDAGGATIDITAGAGAIRIANTDTSEVRFFDWGAALAQAIPADTTRYIGVEYNAGTPQVSIRASDNFNGNDDFTLGVVVNEAGTLHISEHEQNVANAVKNIFDRFSGVEPIARDEKIGGLILDETGTREVIVSAGALWTALHSHSISALDTSGADDFDRYYGSFTKQAAQTQWDNANYDLAGVLTALSANRYSNQYFYLETDGGLVSIYGRAQYPVLAQAQAESAPNGLPDRLGEHAILIGRVVFQEGAGSASAVETVFDTTFSATVTTDHGSLAGLSDDDHVRYFDINGRAGGQTASGDTGAGGDLSLQSNATDSAGDISLRSDTVTMDINGAPEDYVWGYRSAGVDLGLYLQGTTDHTLLNFITKTGDATENVGFRLFAEGQPSDTDVAWMSSQFSSVAGNYQIVSRARGTGTVYPIEFQAGGNNDQLFLSTDGRIGINTMPTIAVLEIINTVGPNEEGIYLKGYNAQAADYFQIWTNGGTNIMAINSTGGVETPKINTDVIDVEVTSEVQVIAPFNIDSELHTPQDNDATAGNIDALDTTGKAAIRLTNAGVVTLRGIDDGTDGKMLTIHNVTGNALTVNDQDANPAAADRIITGIDDDITINDGGALSLQYDSTTQRWRVLSGAGGSGGGGLSPTGTRAAPSNIVAGTGIAYVEDANSPRQIWYIQGNGGAVDITANPQIDAPASLINQELVLIGRSDTNTVLIEDGNGLDLNGSYTMGASDMITLLFDGTNWVEMSRR